MGRELQKKKNRSGIQKVRQKPKSKKNLLKHPIIAANWDNNQTLEQNYKRLGLTVKLNKHTGGVEKKAEDVLKTREEAEQEGEGTRKDDPLAIGAAMKRRERLDVTEAKIERDPKTGKILRIIEPGQARANPLNDPLNELDSDDEEANEMFDQHASKSAPYVSYTGARSEVVRALEKEASRPKASHKPKQSENERAFVAELVKKHGEDFAAMARDMKVNYMQRSEGDLKRRVKKWRGSGGTVA